MTSAQSTRNTSIRTTKIPGEDNLVGSMSIAERAEGTGGIADDIRCWEPVFSPQYGTAVAGKKRPSRAIPQSWVTGAVCLKFRRRRRLDEASEPENVQGVKPGSSCCVFGSIPGFASDPRSI